MKNFKELRIWQKGMDIAVNCFKIVKDFPQQERFGLALQITKSGVSIPSNIAEGSNRSSQKDYSRFVEVSFGSAYELETQLLIAQKTGFGDQPLIQETLAELSDEEKMLLGFLRKLDS